MGFQMGEMYPDSAIEIHFKVREIISLYQRKLTGRNALDAAAGNGFMTQWLLNQGFNVKALDICRDNWEVPNILCEYSDFNEGIEASDNTFDLVVSIETIEHLENPFYFVREISRVLKPNGIAIISTPNVHSIRSRIKYLFCGLPRLFEYVDAELREHITPVSMGQFLYAGSKCGLRVIDVFSTGPRLSLILRLLDLITALGARIVRYTRKNYPDYYMNSLSKKQLRE